MFLADMRSTEELKGGKKKSTAGREGGREQICDNPCVKFRKKLKWLLIKCLGTPWSWKYKTLLFPNGETEAECLTWQKLPGKVMARE